MHVGRKNIDTKYNLRGIDINKTTYEKDIGVIIDEKLDFEKHISEKIKKANSTFAIIRRSFQFLNEETFKPLYKSLVRTHLEYAGAAWRPFKAIDIDRIESVQRRATKQLPGFKNLEYPERLRRLRLPTLSYRRCRGDMIEAYKFIHKLYDTGDTNLLKLWDNCSLRHSQRRNCLQIFPQHCASNVRKNSFTIRISRVWNSLPEEFVSAPSINSFKNRLDKHWHKQEVLYDNHKAVIKINGTRKHNTCRINTINENNEPGEEDPRGPVLGTNPK